MAGSTLAGFDVLAGEKVLEALTQDSIHVAVALWAKTSDYDEPRLFIASPDFDLNSKLEAHTRVADAIQSKFAWSAPNIVILRMSSRFVIALRSLFGHTISVEGMRLGGQLIGDRYIEGAYVFSFAKYCAGIAAIVYRSSEYVRRRIAAERIFVWLSLNR